MIRESILAETPKGSSVDDVISYIGEGLQYEGELRNLPPFEIEGVVVRDTRIISIELGSYAESGAFFLFKTYVHAKWRFDTDERLDDVRVSRGTAGF